MLGTHKLRKRILISSAILLVPASVVVFIVYHQTMQPVPPAVSAQPENHYSAPIPRAVSNKRYVIMGKIEYGDTYPNAIGVYGRVTDSDNKVRTSGYDKCLHYDQSTLIILHPNPKGIIANTGYYGVHCCLKTTYPEVSGFVVPSYWYGDCPSDNNEQDGHD